MRLEEGGYQGGQTKEHDWGGQTEKAHNAPDLLARSPVAPQEPPTLRNLGKGGTNNNNNKFHVRAPP